MSGIGDLGQRCLKLGEFGSEDLPPREEAFDGERGDEEER